MEFLQFHPTALYLPGAPRFLLSEALRGEGAILRNDRGERFMPGYHELAELAPRDVVARAIHQEIVRSTAVAPAVYLDLTHLPAAELAARFPMIHQTCLQYGLELARDPLPTRPAAHYIMGGVRSDLDCRTSLPGLFAAGEAACNGVHGANRLASNSLLEGLVFGARAAQGMLQAPPACTGALHPPEAAAAGDGDPDALLAELRRTMESHVSLVRDAAGLSAAIAKLEEIASALPAADSRATTEARNIAASARAIARSALAREESRGSHYRSDFPARDDAHFQRHSIYNGADVRFQ
jgi:L-aspartate oxidase